MTANMPNGTSFKATFTDKAPAYLLDGCKPGEEFSLTRYSYSVQRPSITPISLHCIAVDKFDKLLANGFVALCS